MDQNEPKYLKKNFIKSFEKTQMLGPQGLEVYIRLT